MYTQYTTPSSSSSTAGLMDRHLSLQPHTRKASSKRKQIGREALKKDMHFCRTDKGKIIAVPCQRRQRPQREYLDTSGRTIYNPGASVSLAMKPSEAFYLAEDEFLAILEELGLLGERRVHSEPEAMPSSEEEQLQAAYEWYAVQEGLQLGDEDSPMDDWESYASEDSGRSTPELCWSPSSWSTVSFDEAEQNVVDFDAIFHQFIDIKQCEGY